MFPCDPLSLLFHACTPKKALYRWKKRDKYHSHFPITIPVSPCGCFSSEGICSPKINMRILNIFFPVSHMRPDDLLKLKLVWEIFKHDWKSYQQCRKQAERGHFFSWIQKFLTRTTCLKFLYSQKMHWFLSQGLSFSPGIQIYLVLLKSCWRAMSSD